MPSTACRAFSRSRPGCTGTNFATGLPRRVLCHNCFSKWRGPGGYPAGPPSTYQPACKPGSVGRQPKLPRDGHSSGMLLAQRLQQPTRTADRGHTIRASSLARSCPRRPYSVLLPVGFAVPSPLPETRCALTAPFHPCVSLAGGRGMLSVALSLRLPSPDVIRHRMSMEPGLSSRGRLSALAPSGRPAD